MKKTIILILTICMLLGASLVMAAPQPPYILFGTIEWNSQMLAGSKLDISVNGVTEQITTDSSGNWQYQITAYSSGNVVTLKVLDGCGTADTCTKTVTIGAEGTKDYAQVDFSITGVLACPPVSCNCGSGSSCNYRESICNDKFPSEECVDKECPTAYYTESECDRLYPDEEVICDVCEEPTPCAEVPVTDCPECEDNGILSGLLEGIALLMLVMGGGIQIYKTRAGGTKILHRHRGILGYHDADRGHRNDLYDHAKISEAPVQYIKDMKRING